jgi:hypothetical protein
MLPSAKCSTDVGNGKKANACKGEWKVDIHPAKRVYYYHPDH